MTWLFSKALMDCANSPSLLEQGVESSAGTYSDGEPFAQWNVMPTPQGFWRNDKMMEALSLSRFGQTLRLLTESHGEGVLTLFLEGFPAKTLATAGTKKASPGLDPAFGQKCCESFSRYDPDTFSWRTSQRCLIEGWERFLGAWPKQGLMLNGECLELPTLAATSPGTAYGLWPTLKASDGDQYSKNLEYFKRRARVAPDLPVIVGLTTPPTESGCYGRINPEFAEWLMGWPAGWTELEPQATGKTQEWRQQHSPSFQKKGNSA